MGDFMKFMDADCKHRKKEVAFALDEIILQSSIGKLEMEWVFLQNRETCFVLVLLHQI